MYVTLKSVMTDQVLLQMSVNKREAIDDSVRRDSPPLLYDPTTLKLNDDYRRPHIHMYGTHRECPVELREGS